MPLVVPAAKVNAVALLEVSETLVSLGDISGTLLPACGCVGSKLKSKFEPEDTLKFNSGVKPEV